MIFLPSYSTRSENDHPHSLENQDRVKKIVHLLIKRRELVTDCSRVEHNFSLVSHIDYKSICFSGIPQSASSKH